MTPQQPLADQDLAYPRGSVSYPRLALVQDGHLGAENDLPLLPRDRVRLLCDDGTLNQLRSSARSEAMGDKARPGDGVIGASGLIGGQPVLCYAQDATFAGGSVGVQHAETIIRVLRLAGEAGVPVIGFIESGGARMQEGVAALNGYGRIFAEHVALSGRVPQISVITGTAAGGGSYSPALTDFVIMTESARMFLTGPDIVREVTGEQLTPAALGGPDVHTANGVCHLTAADDLDAVCLVRKLLGYLPPVSGEPPRRHPSAAPDGGPPEEFVPLDPRKTYDMRRVMRGIVDGDSLLELAADWAPNMVTAFARLDGHAVGVVANQPRHLGGVIDAAASEKGAWFVRLCNSFGIPLIVLVDTPGFLPGSRQEAAGVIRHGAQLLRAFAEATIPRVTVIVRKAFGGAYITMNSAGLGANMVFAWDNAEIGIMGPEQAIMITHRRQLAQAPEPATIRAQLAAEYRAAHLTARSACESGQIDEIIQPNETRSRVSFAICVLTTAREGGRHR